MLLGPRLGSLVATADKTGSSSSNNGIVVVFVRDSLWKTDYEASTSYEISQPLLGVVEGGWWGCTNVMITNPPNSVIVKEEEESREEYIFHSFLLRGSR